MEFITYNKDNIKEYIDFIDSSPSSGLWHYPEWLELQKSSGRVYGGLPFSIKERGKIRLAGIISLSKKAGFIKYGYIQAGYIYDRMDSKLYSYLTAELKRVSRQEGLWFIQVDSITAYDEHFSQILKASSHHYLDTPLPIPQYTTIIDLKQEEDVILAAMKPKGRYNSKLAAKKGVVVKEAGLESLDRFYELLLETTKRDGFSPNSKKYYEKMLTTIPSAKLLMASHEDEIIAGGIFTYTTNQALYYYGASSNHKRNLMAPYLVQWEAIKLGRREGCRYYDFMGIAQPGREKDPLQGVTDFKMKFGGEVTRFLPPYTIAFNSLKYNLYKVLKKIKG